MVQQGEKQEGSGTHAGDTEQPCAAAEVAGSEEHVEAGLWAGIFWIWSER